MPKTPNNQAPTISNNPLQNQQLHTASTSLLPSSPRSQNNSNFSWDCFQPNLSQSSLTTKLNSLQNNLLSKTNSILKLENNFIFHHFHFRVKFPTLDILAYFLALCYTNNWKLQKVQLKTYTMYKTH